MNDIYWLITLGNLSSACTVIFVVSICALVPCVIIMFYNLDREWEREKKAFNSAFRVAKITAIILLTALLGIIFIPSEKQLYAIYGIGGVIDYVKSNDTAKQIPDKVVNYLDAWIDKQIEDEKKNKE